MKRLYDYVALDDYIKRYAPEEMVNEWNLVRSAVYKDSFITNRRKVEVEDVFKTLDKADFNFSTPDIQIVTHDVAIVTMTYHGTFYFPGMKMTFPDCGRTLVLQKIDGNWKIIHFHESMQESEFVQTPLNQ